MGEPLKNLFNEKLIRELSQGIASVYLPFNSSTFHSIIFDENWVNLELKERMNHISRSLKDFLPEDFSDAVDILKTVSLQFDGLGHMVFPGFIEIFGLDDYDVSVDALELFTQSSSSEFAVRPFIKKYPEKMMDKMNLWSQSENHHVRRLSSEGCRPRLPWAMALPDFKKDPAPVLPILKRLKNDESEYVRRSVANNLNDISKDNPQIVLTIAGEWIGNNTNTDKLIKHACRTLLKQGDKDILTLFGYSNPDHLILKDYTVQDSVKMEESLPFSFSIETDRENLGKLRLEYAVDFMKKNGRQARKVFKISESDYRANRKTFERNLSFKSITTRVYYEGRHELAILINGVQLDSKSFYLKKP
jgi:3-methyladenine DNA glycosylase AlkC